MIMMGMGSPVLQLLGLLLPVWVGCTRANSVFGVPSYEKIAGAVHRGGLLHLMAGDGGEVKCYGIRLTKTHGLTMASCSGLGLNVARLSSLSSSSLSNYEPRGEGSNRSFDHLTMSIVAWNNHPDYFTDQVPNFDLAAIQLNITNTNISGWGGLPDLPRLRLPNLNDFTSPPMPRYEKGLTLNMLLLGSRPNITPGGLGTGNLAEPTVADTPKFISKLTWLDQQACRAAHPKVAALNPVYNTGIGCAGTADHSGAGSCAYPPGSPLIRYSRHKLSPPVLVGLLSWSRPCALLDLPAVYTDLRFYTDWISTNINQRHYLPTNHQ